MLVVVQGSSQYPPVEDCGRERESERERLTKRDGEREGGRKGEGEEERQKRGP